jgi:hypothetical protein
MEPPPERSIEAGDEEMRVRREDWIEAAVQAFCRARDARRRFEQSSGRGGA